jgi:hypothetical protein
MKCKLHILTVQSRILGPLISSRNQSIRKGMKHLGSLLEYRLAQEEALGPEWPGRPVPFSLSDSCIKLTAVYQNDLISWLLELAEGSERTAPALVLRILTTNMASLHTITMV